MKFAELMQLLHETLITAHRYELGELQTACEQYAKDYPRSVQRNAPIAAFIDSVRESAAFVAETEFEEHQHCVICQNEGAHPGRPHVMEGQE
jgi:hypothetical protein